MSTPTLESAALATAADVAELQRQLSELRQEVETLKQQASAPSTPPADWREAMARLQAGYASMSDEAKEMAREAEEEARALHRGPRVED